MRLLCSKLHIQQRWDIHPIVTYFWAHCPCPSVSFAINMGYITEPAQLEICRLNSLFPLMVFSPKSVHSSCIHAFFARERQTERQRDRETETETETETEIEKRGWESSSERLIVDCVLTEVSLVLISKILHLIVQPQKQIFLSLNNMGNQGF